MEPKDEPRKSHSNKHGTPVPHPLTAESVWRPIKGDPWSRWDPASEPIRELEVTNVIADDSDTLMIRMPRVDIAPGVIPDPRFDPSADWEDNWSIRFAGRWNATWRGRKLASLSLDLFAEEFDQVLRLPLMAEEPIDLLFACNAAYVGLDTLSICNEGTSARNARNQPLGHRVVCRDPVLAMQISARCYGISPHYELFQAEMWGPSKIESAKGTEAYEELVTVTRSIRNEPAPGLQQALGDDNTQRAVAAMLGEDADGSGLLFKDPIAATLDVYTLIGTMALGFIDDDTRLVRAPDSLARSLGSNVTFAESIAAIRNIDPDGLPLWLDFTTDEGEPAGRLHPSGLSQPLYGALVAFEDNPKEGGPFHAVVPIGRTSGLDPSPLATGVLAVGPDDSWRWPMPDDNLGVITAHRGGVAVRNLHFSYEVDGVEPEVRKDWVRREIAGHFATTSEWVLARVGAILTGLDDGLLSLNRIASSRRTFNLELARPTPAKGRRSHLELDPWDLARRLRKAGSVVRVAEQVGVGVGDIRSTMGMVGIDPDQVRRDEVLKRYRATGSIDAIGLPVHRGDVERFLRDAGIDPHDSPVPHDVTDPESLEAISTYRRTGTLKAAGSELGISAESVRRRIARAGLRTDDIETDVERRLREEACAAYFEANSSLAGASRSLGIDPRTVRDRLMNAGIDPKRGNSRGETQRSEELVGLLELVGTLQQVANLTGASVAEIRKTVGLTSGTKRARRISEDTLDQAEIAYSEHGSIRAAARALGLSPGTFQYRLKKAQSRR